MTSPKILQAATSALTLEAFIAPFASYLSSAGYTVFLASSKSNFIGAEGSLRRLRGAGFTVGTVTMRREINLFYDLVSLLELYRFIRRERFDIVHTYTSKAGFIGRLAARAAGVPVVVHTAYDLHFRAHLAPVARRVYLFLERFAARQCDAIFFASDAVRDAALTNDMKRSSQLIKVGIGIDLDRFSTNALNTQQVRNELGLEADNYVVGTIGRLVRHKGIDCFLRAAALVLRAAPQTRFLVVGDGPQRRELEDLTRSLGIAQSVTFTGFMENPSDIPRVLAGMDVFVLPSQREGFGMVFAEAMAMGVPVVGSKIAPITEVVKDGETGILAPPNHPQLFAEAVVLLLGDEAKRKGMGQAGRVRVESEFDERSSFQRVESLYQELLRQKKVVLQA